MESGKDILLKFDMRRSRNIFVEKRNNQESEAAELRNEQDGEEISPLRGLGSGWLDPFLQRCGREAAGIQWV